MMACLLFARAWLRLFREKYLGVSTIALRLFKKKKIIIIISLETSYTTSNLMVVFQTCQYTQNRQFDFELCIWCEKNIPCFMPFSVKGNKLMSFTETNLYSRILY